MNWQDELRRTGIKLIRNPNDLHSLAQRGAAAYQLGMWDLAVESFAKARQVGGDIPLILRNMVRAHLKLFQPDVALNLCQQLLSLPSDGQDAENMALYGATLSECGLATEAIGVLRECEKLFGPGHHENNANLANNLLALGQWDEGLVRYEQRRTITDAGSQQSWEMLAALPAWDPATDTDADLVIGAEQGCGDLIMISRFLPTIAARTRSTIVMVHPPLLTFLSQNFAHISNLRFVSRSSGAVVQGNRSLMAMSILKSLGIQPGAIPFPYGYLSAATWASSKRLTRNRHAIGFAWQGSREHKEDAVRSLPPALVLPFIENLPHIDFYALSPPSMSPLLGSPPPNLHFTINESSGFEASAALIEEMDLVISVDSAPCHLSGALGVPTWTLLRRNPDWRWGHEDGCVPRWYGSMELIRQTKSGDWQEVLARVTSRLQLPL